MTEKIRKGQLSLWAEDTNGREFECYADRGYYPRGRHKIPQGKMLRIGGQRANGGMATTWVCPACLRHRKLIERVSEVWEDAVTLV